MPHFHFFFGNHLQNTGYFGPVFWKVITLSDTVAKEGQGRFIVMAPSPGYKNNGHFSHYFLIEFQVSSAKNVILVKYQGDNMFKQLQCCNKLMLFARGKLF